MRWTSNGSKTTPEKKLKILDVLQGYIDKGLVTCDNTGHRINGKPATLAELVKKYGSIKNWTISQYTDLNDYYKKHNKPEEEKKVTEPDIKKKVVSKPKKKAVVKKK